MSDTPVERNSNSKSNLIEVQHVGVTAKLQSPLKNLLPMSSSTESDTGHLVYQPRSKYNKFSNDTPMDTESNTDTPKVLYEMRALRTQYKLPTPQPTLSKIEFQLYNNSTRRWRRNNNTNGARQKHKLKPKSKSRIPEKPTRAATNDPKPKTPSIFARLFNSLDCMCRSKQPDSRTHKVKSSCTLVDLGENAKPEDAAKPTESPGGGGGGGGIGIGEVRIGIYPFEHGCAEYLRTTDCPPHIISLVLAERATNYATRFWAEVFGSLQIAVSFLVTFLLQSYRFVLYSLINTLLVGFLHMTSDYLIKPILTVIFNGFLQPPLIFIYNILTSVRDILEPVADTINNFVKPLATVGNSVRLVHVSYNQRKIVKGV